MTELFKDESARQKIRTWHDRFKARIPQPTESRTLDTTFGKTHVLSAGPQSRPPLVVLHGAMASSAHLLVELAPLLERFRVHAVDVIGQSVMSEDTRLAVKGNDYGQWLTQVLDGLGLESTNVLGVSWGGFVTLRLASVSPARIRRLALLVPAGLVTGSTWQGLVKTAWPMTRFIMSPTPERLQALGASLLTTLDDDWLPYIGDAFTSYDMKKMKVPALARDGEFAQLTAPVLVIGAEHDVSFPGDKVVARARQLFKSADVEVIPGAKHSPPTTPQFRQWLAGRLTAFFEPAN